MAWLCRPRLHCLRIGLLLIFLAAFVILTFTVRMSHTIDMINQAPSSSNYHQLPKKTTTWRSVVTSTLSLLEPLPQRVQTTNGSTVGLEEVIRLKGASHPEKIDYENGSTVGLEEVVRLKGGSHPEEIDYENGSTVGLEEVIRLKGGSHPEEIDYEDTMINPHNFSYILNERNICSLVRPDLFVLIFIHTSPGHFRHRAIIRKTWGNPGLYARLRSVTVFVMGKAADPETQSVIFLESERYRDIIQEDFVDSYRNLTYKVVAGFKWVTKFCLNARFVLKSDDDMFINVFNLVRHLEFLSKHQEHMEEIMCQSWNNMPAVRDNSSKWYVTEEEFAEDFYPQYCSGSAYVLPIEIVPRMYNVSLFTRFLWVDDVYASGVVAEAAQIKHKNMASLYVNRKEEFFENLIKGDAVFAHMLGKEGLDTRLSYWAKALLKETT